MGRSINSFRQAYLGWLSYAYVSYFRHAEPRRPEQRHPEFVSGSYPVSTSLKCSLPNYDLPAP